MNYEYKCISTNDWPAPEHLTEMSKDGWRVLQMSRRSSNEILIYFIREAAGHGT